MKEGSSFDLTRCLGGLIRIMNVKGLRRCRPARSPLIVAAAGSRGGLSLYEPSFSGRTGFSFPRSSRGGK